MPPTDDDHTDAPTARPSLKSFLALSLGSAGVVYGDIGTSPLYAFKESITHLRDNAGRAAPSDVIGVVSLMFWALMVIVTVKYVLILMRFGNRGEGGTLSLMALVQRAGGRGAKAIVLIGMLGAGLFFGDAMLTPAISVLSAVEGLKVVHGLEGRLDNFVVPISLVILVGLFMVQRHGTGGVGRWFGPICVVWFAVIAGLGLLAIPRAPEILRALKPLEGLGLFQRHPLLSPAVIGSVFLTVTGAEALYADMGHFGRKPIVAMWLWLVMPCLAINYLGQGAMVLARPETLDNPFFLMAPPMLQAPLVILATLATIVASQAVITGAYSLTQQAVQLGLLPRLQIVNTSAKEHGQIYMPQINYMLLAGVVFLVIAFKSSSALANAYGVSVIGAMITSSILAVVAVRRVWKKSLWLATLIVAPFLVVEGVFLASNLLKVPSGGYIPLLIATGLMLVMWTWVRGTKLLLARTRKDVSTLDVFKGLEVSPPHTVKGTAVFLTADPDAAPTALLHNLKHNKVLHEHNVILNVRTEQVPYVPDEKKVEVVEIFHNLNRLTMHFGYMETPNVARGLTLAKKCGLSFDIMHTSFFLSRRTLLADGKWGMPLWQDHLFIFLSRNATNATEFFRIPTSRVVELGSQMTI